MDALITALARTEWLIGAAVAVVILGVIGAIAFYKPWVIPVRTHEEQLAAERARADRAEAEAETEINRVREEMADRMANLRADIAQRTERDERVFNTMLAEAKRYADDWKGTAHITAENAKISEDRMDEVLETVRLMAGILTALQNHARSSQLTGGQQ